VRPRVATTIKDTASNNIARGWCRLMGLAPLMLWLACALTVRNQGIPAANDARQADNQRRAAAGLPPRTRKRRRTTLAQLAAPPAVTTTPRGKQTTTSDPDVNMDADKM